ncbi:hypothetical protein Tco_0084175 [Tanacetum coccineum]
MKVCNGGNEIYGMDEEGVLKFWYCYLDNDRKSIKGGGLSFHEFLLVRYGESQEKDLIWDHRTHRLKDPRSRSFNDYKWMFDLEIDQLADEYELGIGKKGHMLDDIWENYKKVQRDNTYWWHDHGLEENERQETGLDMEEYAPPKQGIGIRRLPYSSLCDKKGSVWALPLWLRRNRWDMRFLKMQGSNNDLFPLLSKD